MTPNERGHLSEQKCWPYAAFRHQQRTAEQCSGRMVCVLRDVVMRLTGYWFQRDTHGHPTWRCSAVRGAFCRLSLPEPLVCAGSVLKARVFWGLFRKV